MRRARRAIVRARALAPVITFAAGVARDLPRWFRYGRLVEVPPWRRAACAPLVLALSAAAYGCQAAGMYAAMIAPERMRRFSDGH